MMTMIIPPMMAMMIPILIMMMTATLATKTSTPWLDRETASPFECGFSPLSKARIPFSLRFFLLAVLFLIFDIEIVILLPTPILAHTTPLFNYAMPLFSFLTILLSGLLHEWNEGSLDWSN